MIFERDSLIKPYECTIVHPSLPGNSVHSWCMTLLYILAGLILAGIVYIGWKLTMQSGSKDETILRELLENVRRDITNTKDTMTDQLGKNATHIQQRLEKTLDLVGQQLGSMDTRIDHRVKDINSRLDVAAKIMGDVQKQYGTVEGLSHDIKRLQEAFKAPKLRGGFGEKALVDLVSQMLPSQRVHPQFTFATGAMVDVMIETTQGKLCIDAKFPLENYLKLLDNPSDEKLKTLFVNDVKKHIRDIAKKYILPEENTLDSACMYVPSDAVIYEILREPELTEFANEQRVTVLSPHTLQAFLSVLYAAYQSQQFAENAKQVLSLIRGIEQQNGKLGEELRLLQKHLSNATSKMGDVSGEHARLDMQIAQANMLDTSPTHSAIDTKTMNVLAENIDQVLVR